jgi:hypothetical protein
VAEEPIARIGQVGLVPEAARDHWHILGVTTGLPGVLVAVSFP